MRREAVRKNPNPNRDERPSRATRHESGVNASFAPLGSDQWRPPGFADMMSREGGPIMKLEEWPMFVRPFICRYGCIAFDGGIYMRSETTKIGFLSV